MTKEERRIEAVAQAEEEAWASRVLAGARQLLNDLVRRDRLTVAQFQAIDFGLKLIEKASDAAKQTAGLQEINAPF